MKTSSPCSECDRGAKKSNRSPVGANAMVWGPSELFPFIPRHRQTVAEMNYDLFQP
jgi:hypothetical protein